MNAEMLDSEAKIVLRNDLFLTGCAVEAVIKSETSWHTLSKFASSLCISLVRTELHDS
jgi:hypothetical protein